MTLRWVVLLGCVTVFAAQGQERATQGSAELSDFNKRVAAYVKLHNTVKAQVHPVRSTKSAQAIAEYEERFADGLRKARAGARQGDILTNEIAAEFRRLIAIPMRGSEAASIRASLQHAAPVQVSGLGVNQDYPRGLALQSTPPSLLLNLPPLPPALDYRVVGHDLILRDIDANLVVDVVSNAIL